MSGSFITASFPEVATTTFAVINGLANSPSHRQWEIVQLREDLGRAEDALTDLQSAIHSVRPAAETFTDWTRSHHLTDASADAQADPDNDGSPNFLEFAYGTNPTVTRFHHRPSSRERKTKSPSLTAKPTT